MPNPTHQTNDIDLTPYASPLRIGGQHAIVLVAQLAVAAPSDLSVSGRRALERAQARASDVSAVLKARAKTWVGGLRPVLASFDTAYGALYQRLTAAAKLAPSFGDVGERAQKIVDAVLIDGLSFLVNDAETKYAESQRRLEVVEEKRLAAEIDAVAGVGFLDAVKAAHAALGEAIGVGETPVRHTRSELQSAVAALRLAIADYGLQLGAQVDRDDAATVRAFREAVMPIDRFRAEHAGREEEEDEELVVTPGNGAPRPEMPSPFVTGDAE